MLTATDLIQLIVAQLSNAPFVRGAPHGRHALCRPREIEGQFFAHSKLLPPAPMLVILYARNAGASHTFFK